MHHASCKGQLPVYLVFLVLSKCSLGGDIISSSKLEKCIADGTQTNSTSSSALSCSQKLVVTLTVDSGDSIPTQNIQLSLDCIGSPTGNCPCPCNYASDSTCTCRDLSSTLTVALTKGPLWASYPLEYLQAFNYKPYEAITRPGAGNCKDGEYETSPTCGWYYSAGVKVRDSQGFCCNCDTAQIWDDTFGTNTQRTRANLDCDFFSSPLDILIGKLPCSAHCLMMDPHWYGGYALGESSMQFIITAALSYTATTGLSNETIIISPAVPVALSNGGTLSAKLLGDLSGYTSMPVLSERVLMIPHPKQGQTLADVFADRTEWMLLPNSMVSFDGSGCDKVGTSFTGFRFQPLGCKRAPQVCLSNQLSDLLASDKARIAGGKVPLYLVSQYTNGLDSDLRTFVGGPLSFALPQTGIHSSVVQLEASADSMKLVVNVSPGKILDARMCTFAETTCGGFEASASRGYLQAWLANQGVLDATYTISVTNCSVSITAVSAQRVAIPAGGNGTIAPFQIFVQDDKASTTRYCWIVMYNSQAAVTDKMLVPFYTNATVYEAWPTGGLQNNGTGAGTLSNVTCDNACSNKWDLWCQTKHRCWKKIGHIFGLVLGLAAGLTLLTALAWKLGFITSLFQMCMGSVGGGGGLLSWLSPSGRGAERSKNIGKGDKDERRRYDLEDKDSASGGKRERRSQKGGSGKKHRRSRSENNIYDKYDNEFNNELFDEQDPSAPELQRIQRSNSKHNNRYVDPKGGRNSKRSSARDSRAAAAAAYSADEVLQHHQQQYSDEYTNSDEEGIANYSRGNSFCTYKSDYAAGNGSSGSSGKKHRHRGSSSSRVPWDESAAGGGYRPHRHEGPEHNNKYRARKSKSPRQEENLFHSDEEPFEGTTNELFQLEIPDGSATASRTSHSYRTTSSSPGTLLPAAAAAVGRGGGSRTRLSDLVGTARSASAYLADLDPDLAGSGSRSKVPDRHDEQQQQQRLQQQMFTQPSRAATMPGGLTAAAATAAAAAAGSSMVRASMSPMRAGLAATAAAAAAKSPAILARSRENSGDSATLQPDYQVQQQQQQQQQYGILQGRPSASTLTRRPSAVGATRAEDTWQQQQQQQISHRTAVDRQPTAALPQQQQQQQGRPSRQSRSPGVARKLSIEPDNFFMPYSSDNNSGPGDSEASDSDRGRKSTAARSDSQQRQQQRDPPVGRHRSSAAALQQQQQQQSMQRGMSVPGGTAAAAADNYMRSASPQRQQQQQQTAAVSKWAVMAGPVSTTSRPLLAQFYDSSSGGTGSSSPPRTPPRGSSSSSPQQQQQQQRSSSGPRQASGSVTSAPGHDTAAGGSSSSRRMASEPGSFGRHSPQQQQQQQQQRPSVAVLASRAPGHVRSAAAAMSSPGSSPKRPISSSSSPVRGSGSSSPTRGPGQARQNSRQHDMTNNQ